MRLAAACIRDVIRLATLYHEPKGRRILRRFRREALAAEQRLEPPQAIGPTIAKVN